MSSLNTKKIFPVHRVIVLLLLLPLLLPVPGRLHALKPGKTIDDFTLNGFSIPDGLPQNSILCLIQARSGYIWFGTRSGLVRFDGVTPRVFNRWNTPALKNDTILSLCEDATGVLWIGTDGAGLVSLDSTNGETWKAYPDTEGLSNNRVRTIFAGISGNLWIGTDYGLNLRKDGKFTVFTGSDGLTGNAVNAITAGPGGSLWIGTDSSGLSLLKAGVFHSYLIPVNSHELPFGTEITALRSDAAGVLWIGSENGLFFLKNENAQVEPYRTGAALFTEPIRAITADKDGNLWIGTYGSGLLQVGNIASYLTSGASGSRITCLLNTNNGFLDDYIYSLMEDDDGSLWAGTYTSGLVQLQNSKFETLSRDTGLPENMIYTVCEDPQGSLWIGTEDQGLVQVTGQRIIKIWTVQDGLPGNQVRALYRDSRGNLWIGTENNGLARFKDGRFYAFGSTQGLSSLHITAITAAQTTANNSKPAIWVGTDRGLYRVEEEGRVIDLTRLAGDHTISSLHPTQRMINALLVSRQYGLLLGTKGGPVCFTDGKFQPVTDSEGKKIDIEVLSLYEDAGQNLWMGTRGSGLLCLHEGEGKLTTYTTRSGLHDNYIFSIMEETFPNPVAQSDPNRPGQPAKQDENPARSYLWMSSYRGIFRVSAEELQQFAGNKIQAITSVYFDEKDGMKSSECAAGGQPAGWQTASGKLCYPTVKGLAILDAPALAGGQRLPRVKIEAVIVDNEMVIPGSKTKYRFPQEKKMFEFNFTALNFRAPQRIKFRYKLQGFDKGWTETQADQKRTALYINLDPGDYRFDVSACNDDGVWSPTATGFAFSIARAFFSSPLFYSLIALVLLAGGGGFLLWRQKQKQKTQPQKIEKYKTSALDPAMAEEVLPKLLRLMEKEKVYLDPDLNLKKLSEKLMIHYNYLSQIINEKLDSNFNDFVNKYRIEEARKLLLDPAMEKKTVLDIAYDTGFYSKSVFNTAFKKFTGLTPTAYRKAQRRK